MRTLVVVEVDGLLYGCPHLLDGEERDVLEQLVLDDAVDALGDGIVLGVSAFGHTNLDIPRQEFLHIGKAGILDAAVGVMDEVLAALAFNP